MRPSRPSQADVVVPPKNWSPVVAVDVSASTRGKILEAEKDAIKRLAASWPSEARSANSIVPWNHDVSSARDLKSVDNLWSSGSTNPSSLVKGAQSISLLQDSSLWYLLTDGQIDPQSIRDFAAGLVENGLHGKACVIILFGYQNLRPLSCNVSVGQAVFGAVPHCAFLFHAVDTDKTFIFQCKGCFRSLLPQGQSDIVLDNKTTWEKLPTTSYEQVSTISVPEAGLIPAGTVLLGSGKIIGFDDLCNGRLDRQETRKILESDDDLKSLLLTAQNLGRSEDVKRWLHNQRNERTGSAYADRPDFNQKASKLVQQLVEAMRAELRDLEHEKQLKTKLRKAHFANWANFVNSIGNAKTDDKRINTIMEDALTRLRLYEDNCASPVMMSPVSPTFSRPSEEETHDIYRHEALPDPAIIDNHSARRTRVSLSRSTYRPAQFPQSAPTLGLLHSKGYKLDVNSTKHRPFRGKCSICSGVDSPLALLLKEKPSFYETEGGFPSTGSHQSIAYPLAMGNFPETDILSSFICCEVCATYVRAIGYSPMDDSVTGIIPLVPLSTGMNRKLVVEVIDAALEGRFDVAILDQIFLSILYRKLEDIGMENFPEDELEVQCRSALTWQCRSFTDSITLPSTLSIPDSGKVTAEATFAKSVTSSLLGSTSEQRFHLLHYPLEGFVTLLKGTIELGHPNLPQGSIRSMVVQRLLLHLAEQHRLLIDETGPDVASQDLERILKGEVGGLVPDQYQANVESIAGTYLLQDDDLANFHRLPGQVFQQVEHNCGVAIYLFLTLMARLPWEDRSAMEFYEFSRTKLGEPQYFDFASKLDENRVRSLLSLAVLQSGI